MTDDGDDIDDDLLPDRDDMPMAKIATVFLVVMLALIGAGWSLGGNLDLGEQDTVPPEATPTPADTPTATPDATPEPPDSTPETPTATETATPTPTEDGVPRGFGGGGSDPAPVGHQDGSGEALAG